MRLVHPICISLLVTGAFCAFAARADAASVVASASGTIWGTPAGDQELGNGSALVSAAAAYQRPPQVNDGGFSAECSAAVGLLAARADLSVTNAPGYLSANFSLYGTSLVSGLGQFQDRWIFSGRPLDTPGRLRLVLAFDGVGAGSATNAIAEAYGKFDFSILSLEEFDGVYASQVYASGQLQVADETVPLELDFLYGRPLLLSGTLVAKVQLLSVLSAYAYSGSGESDFNHTASLVSLQVQNPQGQWTSSYTLETESGGTYPFQVPEPGSTLSAVAGMLALALVRAR